MNESVVIVGVGNTYRRDDGAGPTAATRLRALLPGHIRVLVQEGDLASALDDWQGANAVILIDATSSGQTPGTIQRFDAHDSPLPSTFSTSSTHSFGVRDAIELARVLGRLPARIVVFGIEGRDFTEGVGISREVDAAVDEVVRRVIEDGGVGPH
jgi:hydrogenase maturation protease